MTKAVKRSVSIVLTILMLMSMCVVGSFTGIAATTNDETVGVSYDGTTKLYLDSNGCYWWNDADAVMGVSFRGSTTTTPVAMTPVEGRTKIFEVTVPAGDYTQVVFSRHESIGSAAWNSVTATLQSDRNLFVLNSGANGGSWDNFDEGATDPPVVYGPQTIYFDNTNTRWSEVYVYGWAFGLSETFEKMDLVEGNIYSYTFSEEPVAGQEGFLFVNKGSWTSQQQTVNVMLEEGKNLYTNLSGSGTTWSGTWDVYTPVTTDPTEPEPTEPEPTEPEPTEPEPTEPEPTEPEPTEPEPTEPEPTEPEPTEPEDTIIVYYSPSQAWLDAGYTVKANAQGSMELWTQVDMTNTDETINGQPVYKAEFAMDAAPYGGFDTLQFQAYNGSQWIEQVVAISSWATTDTFNGKYYNGAGWVDYVPDSEIDPTEPEPTEPEPTEPEPTEPEPTEPEPTEPEPTEPEPTEPEPTEPEPTEPEPTEPEPTEPEPTEPEPTEPEPTEPEPTEPPAGERYMLGDVTFDDEITLEDILIMQRSMAMMTTLTQLQMTAGDVDRNGNIEIADVLEVQKYLAKMSTQYDIGKVFNDATIPTEPEPTEPQPTEPEPTEPEPTEPEPTEPQPTEPEPTEPQPTEPSDSNEVTLYFSNGVSWDKVYIYTWRTSDENKNAEWPGEEMTAVGQNSFGETIYQINIDLSQYDNVIFNNGSGQQTEDIPLTSASNNMGYYCDKNVQNAQGHYGYGTYLFDPSFIV